MSTTRGAVAPMTDRSSVDTVDTDDLDRIVAALAGRVGEWAHTSAAARADLLDRVLVDTLRAQEAWLAAACRAKGLDPKSPEAGEELFAGIGTFVRMTRLYRDSIREIARTGSPRFAGPVSRADDGRLKVRVFPDSTFDRVLYAQTTAEVWMQPGVTEAELKTGQAAAYKDPVSHQGVALVLGAGNVGSLGPRDVLTKLFVEGKVVVLKSNPVNDYLVPHWTKAFRPLIDAGVLAIVTGGTETGAYLTHHGQIDEVHITGSDKTHDAIVFGTGEAGAQAKANGQVQLDKPVSSELGNVSPVIIVPGQWSAADLVYQAEHVATMLANNAGFNCLSARVIITHDRWPQREAFLGALSHALTQIPTRRAYYPGAEERRARFVDSHPEATSLGRATADTAPWTLIDGVDPGRAGDICFNVEAFCGLTAESPMPATSTADFVAKAVEFCNNTLWGTLSATIIVHPKTLADPAVAQAVEEAVADLRYGAIGVNIWHAIDFALGVTTWGAYPGHSVTDIQSGRGVVGNANMFDRPEKSVVRGPFRSRPKPPWFATTKNQLAIMQKMVAFEADPTPQKIPGILLAALRG
jgi:acyl-CoA reductase-like NAD-dependent aldehyde dehydrogenase